MRKTNLELSIFIGVAVSIVLSSINDIGKHEDYIIGNELWITALLFPSIIFLLGWTASKKHYNN